MSIQKLAETARGVFELRKRDNGDEFWAAKEGAPDWIQPMCLAAHDSGHFLPDDWRYSFIVDALNALADHEDEDEARDSLEAEVYTARLTAWLASNVNRLGYCDEAVDEYGGEVFGGRNGGGTFMLLQLGQQKEMQEVFQSVLDFLRERAEEEEETEGAEV